MTVRLMDGSSQGVCTPGGENCSSERRVGRIVLPGCGGVKKNRVPDAARLLKSADSAEQLPPGRRLQVACILRPPPTLDRMRDQLEHSFRRQANISSANSAGHVMCYRHFSMPLASANLMVIM
jgi:hypothetical protein